MSRAWYVFMGGNDVTNASAYYKITVQHACLCGNEICAIYAADNGQHPTSPLSPNLLRYIKDALATELLQPSSPYDAKKYVYLKSR